MLAVSGWLALPTVSRVGLGEPNHTIAGAMTQEPMKVVSDENGVITTDGLRSVHMSELLIREPRVDWQEDARRFLEYVGRHVISPGRIIQPGETMNYGFWLIRFVASGGFLDLARHAADPARRSIGHFPGRAAVMPALEFPHH